MIMKKLYFTLAAIFVSSLVMAQETTTKNYVKSTTYQVSTSTGSVTNDEKIETITYSDGLGRSEQSRVKQGGGNREDIITPIIYDGFGRQAKQYLPYSDTGTSSLYYKTPSTLISDIESYYIANFPSDINSSTPNPYSENGYDGSPLNRTLQQAAPGDDWQIGSGHEIDFVYETNSLDTLQHYTVNLSFANDMYTPTLVLSGSYAANELFKIITKDENHDETSAFDHTTEEFKDKQGRVILRRTFNNETKHDTYYVYDDYGNLTYVLPPKSEPNTALPNSTELDELCYQYKYDVRNRIIEKKVPGKEWEYMVYNKLDQPILTQDPNLKIEDSWLFTKYDAFGRVAYSGLDSNNTNSRTTMQTSANATSLQSVTKTTNANTNGDTSMYYNNDAYPSSYDEIHTINYYDTYVDLPAGLSSTVTTSFGLTSTTDTQSLPTVSKVRVLTTNNWITTVSYYDSKGRPIYVYTTNPYLGTTDIIETDLDFTGKPEQIKTTHTKGTTTTTTLEVFTYDHTGRVTKQTHKINTGNEEVIAQNTYDGLGQLKNKKVGNTVASPLQTIDYSYNVRGWLKQINNPTSLGSDLFAYKLNYNTVDHSGTKLYNGNIAETEWKTASDNTLRWYRYGYDDLNRISSAINNSTNYNLTSVSYDKNGNITNLTRRGQINSGATSFGNMDVLVYTYQQSGVSNQLEKVLDNGNDTYGFKDGVNQTVEYTFDNNGNLTTDDNKGITSISYNHLNLPTQINFGSSNKIEYFYDAAGVKLKKKVTENSTITTTDYANGFIYENSALQFFNTAEGYVEPNGTNFDYIYQFKDHLDNIRLSYIDVNQNNASAVSIILKEEHNYYPFGLKHKGYNTNINGTHHKYMFGSKEYDESFQSLNTYDFGARNYDPALGRWMNIDPLAELMRRHSPYNYAFDNPLRFIDPDGMAPLDIIVENTETNTITRVKNDDETDTWVKDGVTTETGLTKAQTEGRIAEATHGDSQLTSNEVTIKYGEDADQSTVSNFTTSVIVDVMNETDNSSIQINSTARNPEGQARAMSEMVDGDGMAAAKDLYGKNGDIVLDQYPNMGAMVDKINELGPANVSNHIRNTDEINVVDVSPWRNGIKRPKAFAITAQRHKGVSQVWSPYNSKDRAIHIEIPQPR